MPLATPPPPPVRAWIRPEALQAMLDVYAHSEQVEPCGLLLGKRENGVVRVSEVLSLPNVHPLPQRAFRLDPAEHLRATHAAHDQGLDVVGYWHGHLEGPPEPSRADQENLDEYAEAIDRGSTAPLLVILGRGSSEVPVVRAWAQGPRELREIPLGA